MSKKLKAVILIISYAIIIFTSKKISNTFTSGLIAEGLCVTIYLILDEYFKEDNK